MVGAAVQRQLEARGFRNVLTRVRAKLDLTDTIAVRDYFQTERPDSVFLCAARVGGILANRDQPAEFIRDNIAIQTNIIHEAWRAGVKHLVFLGSSCIYPRDCLQPIREEYLLTGPLEFTNRPYAIAKISGVEMCWAYNRQYGTSYLALMPTNLYGTGDNFDTQTSHVLPALIRKMVQAKEDGRPEVTLWGTGTPRREFLYADDMAGAAVHLASLDPERISRAIPADQPPLINIGCGKDLMIRDLAELVREATGFRGDIRWDTSKPDGTPRKLLDVSRVTSLGWQPSTTLADGIRETCAWFMQHRDRFR